MKSLIQLTLVYLFTVNISIGQTTDSTIQKLIQVDLIQKEQIEEYKALLERFDYRENSIYLFALLSLEAKRLTGSYDTPMGSAITYRNKILSMVIQDEIKPFLNTYLKKVHKAGLINKNQLEKFQLKIYQDKITHLQQLQLELVEKVAQSERMAPPKLLPYAEKLKNGKIVTNQYDELILDINEGLIENSFQFLEYCDKAVIIDENDYFEQPKDYLEAIHNKTATILPELKFTNFSFEILMDNQISSTDSKYYDFLVQLESNGQIYKHKSSYQLYSPSNDQYYGNKIDQQEYYAIFNKILADQQSPYRLHEVKSYQDIGVNWEVFGIIALTEEQADYLHNGSVYFSPSFENFDNSLSSQQIDQAIEEFEKLGIFSHLTKEEINQAKQNVSEQENRSLNDVLKCFPDCIYHFDMELYNLKNPYEELIQGFSKITKGEFNPSQIVADFDIRNNKEVHIGFEVNGANYTKTLKIEEDWIDLEFFDFIKSVVTKSQLKGQFYHLYTGGQDAAVVFLTRKQYEYFHIHKLLDFGDDYESQK